MRTETVRDSSGVIAPILLTAGETRRILNISDATLKRLGILDVLNPLKFSREKRYRRSEVEAFTALGPEKLSAIAGQLAALSRKNKARAADNGLSGSGVRGGRKK